MPSLSVTRLVVLESVGGLEQLRLKSISLTSLSGMACLRYLIALESQFSGAGMNTILNEYDKSEKKGVK